MVHDEFTSTIPRIGEIVVISCSNSNHWSFLRAICDKCELTDHDVVFGQRQINEDLLIYLYGLDDNGKLHDFAWDLVVHKMLGYVVLFEWYDYDSFPATKETIDYLTDRIDAPLIVTADVHDQPFPIPANMFDEGISISANARFTFCRSSDSDSVKSVLRMLFDIVIERQV